MFVRLREQRFGDAAAVGVKSVFNDLPGVFEQVFVSDFSHAISPRSIQYGSASLHNLPSARKPCNIFSGKSMHQASWLMRRNGFLSGVLDRVCFSRRPDKIVPLQTQRRKKFVERLCNSGCAKTD